MINYHNKKFISVQNSENGETDKGTVFHYLQDGNIIYSEYSGGKILKGHLLGKVTKEGKLEFVYHQVNDQGILMTGKCVSTPEILANGKIRLHETWEWTSGDFSKGKSILEETE